MLMDLLNDSHIAVIRSFFAMASSTLVVAIVAIVKETIVAKNFGASNELDAFLFSWLHEAGSRILTSGNCDFLVIA